MQALEDRIVEMHAVGDERWSVLLAPWVMAFGCLRYAHIARSEPRRLTAAFLHCRCPKGKQKHAREGFDFVVPATFANGFFWAKEVLEAYRTLAPARQRLAGLCFSDEGRPWTILEVQETMQNEMAVFLDNPEDITTYSWRRMAPTVAQLLECRPEEMAALGDWQNKGEQPEVGRMAFHYYSSAKYAASIKVKSLVWGATAKADQQPALGGDPTGRVGGRPQPWLSRGRQIAEARSSANLGLVAELPGCEKEAEAVSAVCGSGATAREEAEAAPAPQMPDQLNGKVLTATLKNGKAICPDFQTDECPNPADTCPFGVHLCAILQKSGRACGGKRGAGGNIKRAVMAASSTAPKPSATLVPAALGAKAQFTRKRAAASSTTDDEVADVEGGCEEGRRKGSPQDSAEGDSSCGSKDTSKGDAESSHESSDQVGSWQTAGESYAEEGPREGHTSCPG